MTARQSIGIDGFSHGAQPIPAASRVGPLVVTGGIFGLDRGSGTIPDDPAEQVRLVFANLGAIIEAAGGTLDAVARLTFHVKQASIRPLINNEWLRAFPDPASRPARHTITNPDLAANILLQCEALAWVGA